MQDLKLRMSTFLITLGVAILFLYFTSDVASFFNRSYDPQLLLLFIGVLVLWWGIRLRRKVTAPPAPSERFKLVKKLFGGKKGKGNGGGGGDSAPEGGGGGDGDG